MGVAGGVLDEWNKDIARLPELEKEHYGPIGSYVLCFFIFILFYFLLVFY